MMGPSMMLHYSGWRGEEMTEKTLVEHPDGNTWLHTGDEAYITEQGIVHILDVEISSVTEINHFI